MASRQTDRQDGTVAADPHRGERRPGLRAVGAASSRIAAAILARRGGAGLLGRLKAEWPAIAGAELAATTWPEALGRDGALKLRVEPGRALELQHRAPLAIERINGFFGRSVVARLVLVQGPMPLPAPARPPPQAPQLTAAATTVLEAKLAGIADPELRAALAGLGRLVLPENRDG